MSCKPLSSLGFIVTGKTPSTKNSEFWSGTIPFITPKDIQGTKHIFATERYITVNGLDSAKKAILPPKAICVSCIGNIGYVAMTTQKSLSNQQINSIIVNKQNDADFVYYLMKNLWSFFKHYEGQSTTLSILNKTQFSKIEVDVPPLESQRRIARILSALDDKIELNQQINDNLQQQIFALFQSKYQVPSSGENWVDGCIGDVITLQRGYDLPKNKIVDGPYPVAGSANTIAFHSDFTTEPPCIVMGRSGNIGKPRLYLQKCWAHNTTLFSMEFKNSNPYWVYAMLRNIDYRQFQGGSAVPTLNRNYVHAFPIKIPPKVKQNEFGKFASTLFNAIADNIDESNKLALLRDTLLPKLMSSEIDVSTI